MWVAGYVTPKLRRTMLRQHNCDLHATGEDALMFYTERKVVTSRW